MAKPRLDFMFKGVYGPLTPAECRVVLLLAEGMSDTAIASFLQIQRSTVRQHTFNIFRKLGCNTRTKVAYKFWLNQIPELSDFRLLMPALEDAIARVESRSHRRAA